MSPDSGPEGHSIVQKSPDAFRTISEVAMELDVPQHVLRFWETKFTQIKPLKRGGGRRYYRPEDIDLLRGIRTLLYHDGYTIKGVQKVFREQGLRHVTEIGREELEAELAAMDADGAAAQDETGRQVHDSNDGDWAASANVDDTSPQYLAPAPFPPQPLTEEQQDKLEDILDELERLKARLEAARAAVRA